MEFSHSLIGSDALKAAIDHNPLVVSLNTPLLDVIAQMSQARGGACGILKDDADAERLKVPDKSTYELPSSAQDQPHTAPTRQASCALVINGGPGDQNATAPDVADNTQGIPSVQNHKVVGIFTERDIVRLVAKGVDLAQLKIQDVMISPVISLAESEFRDIFAPLFLFRRYRIRHLLVVDDHERPIGIISPSSIRSVLRPANLLKLRRVSDIMAHNVVCAHYQDSLLKTAQLMTQHRVSCVVITEADEDRGALPIGIVTERDIVQFRTLELDLSIQVGTVMSSPLFLLNPDDSLWTAHQEMQRLRVRRLVVSWNWGKGLGIVTQTSLLRAFDPLEMYGVLETLQTTIEQLQASKQLPGPHPESSRLESSTLEIAPSSLPASSGSFIPEAKNPIENNDSVATPPIPISTPSLHAVPNAPSNIAPAPSLVVVTPEPRPDRPMAIEPSSGPSIRAIASPSEGGASNVPVVVPPLSSQHSNTQHGSHQDVSDTEHAESQRQAIDVHNPYNPLVNHLRQADQTLMDIQARLDDLQCVERDRSTKDGIVSEINTLAHYLRTLEQDLQHQSKEHPGSNAELG